MNPALETLTLADLTLALRLAGVTGGKPSYKDLAAQLDRDASNVRKSVLRLEKLGLVTLDPVSLSTDLADAMERQFGERRSPDDADSQPPQAAASATARPQRERGGDGLDSPEHQNNNPTFLPHGSIQPSPLNPRKAFREEGIAELAASIGAQGMLQPVLVRPIDGGRFEIAAGERRWRAVRKLIEDGLAEADAPVPVIVREMSDIELVELAIVENRDREDVHPLEEAEAYLTLQRLREEEGGDPGEVSAELATRAGRSRRHIQKRIALATRLSGAVKQAFAMGDISLAQAQALSPWPQERQDAALDLIVNRRHGWQTADEINRQMRSGHLLAKHALFPLEAYTGETLEDDAGDIILTDRAQAERLQRAAFEAVVEEERKAGWAEVEVWPGDEYFNARAYEQHPLGKDAPKDEAELHIRLDDRSLEAQAVYLVHEAEDEGEPAPAREAGTTSATVEAQPEHPTTPPFSKRHWIAAASEKTTRLQTAIAAAPPRYAMALAVLALGPQADFRYSGVQEPQNWLHGHRADGEDSKVLNAGMLAWRNSGEDLAGRSGFKAHATLGAVIDDQTEALATLVEAPELPALFAALIAAQCGSWPGYGNAPMGDSLFVRVLAGQLEDLLPPWKMDATYLERFSLPQLARIADACIKPSDPDSGDRPSADMPAKKADAVKWILNHVWRDLTWLPPEMHFDAAADLDARVSAMLAGDPAGPRPGKGTPSALVGGTACPRAGGEPLDSAEEQAQ
ncbi:MAG: ParB/RepB/Spo0J family partition protein [Caulobacterales bacterium]|uniref:ParB/RepB/Spo0J family partition protein n=1 Tax=Glycocaulis sp. TaxID=1969725 RepID=UPI003F9F34AF